MTATKRISDTQPDFIDETDLARVFLLVDATSATKLLSSLTLCPDFVLLLGSRWAGRSTDFVLDRVLIVNGGGLIVLALVNDLFLDTDVSLAACCSSDVLDVLLMVEGDFPRTHASSGSDLPKNITTTMFLLSQFCAKCTSKRWFI